VTARVQKVENEIEKSSDIERETARKAKNAIQLKERNAITKKKMECNQQINKK
jgi:hypothetical protein